MKFKKTIISSTLAVAILAIVISGNTISPINAKELQQVFIVNTSKEPVPTTSVDECVGLSIEFKFVDDANGKIPTELVNTPLRVVILIDPSKVIDTKALLVQYLMQPEGTEVYLGRSISAGNFQQSVVVTNDQIIAVHKNTGAVQLSPGQTCTVTG